MNNLAAYDLAKKLEADGVIDEASFMVGEIREEANTIQFGFLDGVAVVPIKRDLYQQPAVQVFCIGTNTHSANDVYREAMRVHDAINNLPRDAIQGYTRFSVRSFPSIVGKDELDRHMCSANYTVYRSL